MQDATAASADRDEAEKAFWLCEAVVPCLSWQDSKMARASEDRSFVACFA